MNTFSQFKINHNIIKALDEIGYHNPTQVQEQVIPIALENQDLIVLSKTGSGKTGAFSVPLLEVLCHQAIILSPTRELAVQIENEIKKIAKFTNRKTVVVYGGHSMVDEEARLKKNPDIIVGTPGRLHEHIVLQNIDTEKITHVVLDEADRMLDMGFLPQVDSILRLLKKDITTFLFSATMPEQIVSIANKYLNSPRTISLSSDTKTVDDIEQIYYRVEKKKKKQILLSLIATRKPQSCMIFCNTRNEVDYVYNYLADLGLEVRAIHGANSQSSRIRFLEQFKRGDFSILIATDVAARGLHIDDLELVVNYDLPEDKDNYVHRVGRTGRAGKKGQAITFVAENQLYALYEIEEHVGSYIEEMPLPDDSASKEYIEELKLNAELFGASYRERNDGKKRNKGRKKQR